MSAVQNVTSDVIWHVEKQSNILKCRLTGKQSHVVSSLRSIQIQTNYEKQHIV